MAKKQKRDRAYYEDRLKRDHPAIHADLKAGKYRTVADAAIAAGLKKPRTRLHELTNAWEKANRREQHEFLKWIRAGVTGAVSTSSPAVTTTPIAVGRRLVPSAAARIEEIMARRYLEPGDVMAELGYPKLNTSVSMAIRRGWKLKPDVITALEKWLTANASV